MKFVQATTTTETVVSEMRKVLGRQATEWSKVLRIDVLAAPTLRRNDTTIFIRPRTWKQFRRLCMVHWYLPKDAFALIHLELEELEDKFGADKSVAAHAILESEPKMILYVLDSQMFRNERSLFGTLNSPFEFQRFKFSIRRQKKARALVRRRGYKDKGSLRLPHEQHSPKYDYTFTELQNQIEADRQSLKDAEDLISGWLE